jgi:hypothetical protein
MRRAASGGGGKGSDDIDDGTKNGGGYRFGDLTRSLIGGSVERVRFLFFSFLSFFAADDSQLVVIHIVHYHYSPEA